MGFRIHFSHLRLKRQHLVYVSGGCSHPWKEMMRKTVSFACLAPDSSEIKSFWPDHGGSFALWSSRLIFPFKLRGTGGAERAGGKTVLYSSAHGSALEFPVAFEMFRKLFTDPSICWRTQSLITLLLSATVVDMSPNCPEPGKRSHVSTLKESGKSEGRPPFWSVRKWPAPRTQARRCGSASTSNSKPEKGDAAWAAVCGEGCLSVGSGLEGQEVLDCSKVWVSVEEEMGTTWPGQGSGRCAVAPGDQSQGSVSEVGGPGTDARDLEPGFD